MANGIAVGDLIGLAGREGDAVVAQRHAAQWLSLFAVLQIGVVIAIYSLLRFGTEAGLLSRFVSRVAFAAFLSIPATAIVGVFMFEVLRLLLPHVR